jgi:hypothetical protein
MSRALGLCGMTLKQFALARYFRLIELYREVKKHIDTPEGKRRS